MATRPGPNAIDSGSRGGDDEDRRFERLERVRAHRRSRRQRRLVLIGSLVLVLAAAGALGLTAVRRASSGNLGTSGAQTPMTPAVTDAPSSALKVPPPAPSSIGSPPPTEAPAPARAGETNGSSEQKSTERVKAEVVTPRQGQPETPPAAGVTPSTNRAGTPRATVRSEPASTEAGDPTAVIDWLLKTKGQ